MVTCAGLSLPHSAFQSTLNSLNVLYVDAGCSRAVGVDVEFERLLVAIFGFEFIETFKLKRPAGWVDLMAAFESRKRTASPFKNSPLNVSLPFSFIDYHKKYRVRTGLSLSVCLPLSPSPSLPVSPRRELVKQ